MMSIQHKLCYLMLLDHIYCLNYVVVNFIVSSQLTHIVSNQLTPKRALGDLFNIAVTSEQEVAILSLPVPSPEPGGM